MSFAPQLITNKIVSFFSLTDKLVLEQVIQEQLKTVKIKIFLHPLKEQSFFNN